MNSDSVALRLQELNRERRRVSTVIAVAACLCALVLSFAATLYVLETLETADVVRGQEAQTALKEGVWTANGLLVYSPTAKSGDPQPPSRAFSGMHNAASFWETKLPADLIIIFPQAQTLTSYSITAGNLADRMPKTWTLEASVEGARWRTVDGQRVAAWQNEETRTFSVKGAKAIQALRLQFLEGFGGNLLRIYGLEFR